MNDLNLQKTFIKINEIALLSDLSSSLQLIMISPSCKAVSAPTYDDSRGFVNVVKNYLSLRKSTNLSVNDCCRCSVYLTHQLLFITLYCIVLSGSLECDKCYYSNTVNDITFERSIHCSTVHLQT